MAHEPAAESVPVGPTCDGCGITVPPGLLSCPSCRGLIHSGRLKELAAIATSAESGDEPAAALSAWREALALLPPGTRQYSVIVDRIAELGRRVEESPAPEQRGETADEASGWSIGATTGAVGTVGLLVWKFKFLAFVILGKGKLLLLGLTTASTFLSMFASVGVYWMEFGFPFALGLVVSIYLHEMGHVFALSRYGVAASAPLFIPGLGAFIRLKQDFHSPRQDARVALAGPLWGLGAAMICLLFHALLRYPVLLVLAHFGALINLFNLIPIWQLDGGRVFRTLNRPERWLAVTALATAWAATNDVLLLILTIVGAFRAAIDKPSPESDRGALAQYIGLVAALSFLAFAPVFQLP
jgi:Zn-dependent protease